jgi:sarcosine oxidase subunit beta
MTETADAIIIGAGVIGAATAFEMAKAGWKTLTVDRESQAGHGSTAGSCAIIRMHYSTLDGTAFAYEGYHYWRDWAEYLGLPGDATLAQFREVGCLVMKTDANTHLARHLVHSAELGCPFEEWNAEEITRRLPIYALDSYAPAKRLDDPGFGQPNGAHLQGGVFWPNGGYVNDPALSAQNLADAAKAQGARFRLGETVTEILTEGGRVKGVRLASREELHAPVVVNVAGPASSKINEMAGVLDDMTIARGPCGRRWCMFPRPPGVDFEGAGTIVSDGDIGLYCRPGERKSHPDRLRRPRMRSACLWLEDERDLDRNFTDQWSLQALRYAQRAPDARDSRRGCAGWWTFTTPRRTGFRSTTGPRCRDSTWPAAPVPGTSTRTRRSPGS